MCHTLMGSILVSHSRIRTYDIPKQNPGESRSSVSIPPECSPILTGRQEAESRHRKYPLTPSFCRSIKIRDGTRSRPLLGWSRLLVNRGGEAREDRRTRLRFEPYNIPAHPLFFGALSEYTGVRLTEKELSTRFLSFKPGLDIPLETDTMNFLVTISVRWNS